MRKQDRPKNSLCPIGRCVLIGALLTSSAAALTPQRGGASVITADWYQLGENDPGATAGATGDNPTIDSGAGANNLSRAGTPSYSSSTAALSDGSTLAMQFNGTTDGYYSSTANETGVITNVGLEAWVKPGDNTNPIGILAYNGGASGYGIIQQGNQLEWLIQNVQIGSFETITPGDVGQWVHLGMVFDSTGKMTAYVNGVAVNTSNGGLSPPSGGFDIGAGGTLSSPAAFFNGSIDQVRVFTYAGTFNPSDFLIGAVPEPSGLVLLGLGVVGIGVATGSRRRRRRT